MIRESAVFLVGTPIGNLDDLSPRAIETLGVVDVVYAEDTRRTAGLFRRFGISTPLRSLHEHNEAARAAEIIERLQRLRDYEVDYVLLIDVTGSRDSLRIFQNEIMPELA